MHRRLALLALVAAVALGACGDEGDEVGTGAGGAADGGGGGAAATFEGIITDVTRFEPVTEDCTPPEDLDPDGAVSSDDPPVCTDPETAPLGTILVAAADGNQIVFTIGQGTVLMRGGEAIAFDEVTTDVEATVGFDGQVAESFPGQARADRVDVGGVRA